MVFYHTRVSQYCDQNDLLDGYTPLAHHLNLHISFVIHSEVISTPDTDITQPDLVLNWFQDYICPLLLLVHDPNSINTSIL